MRTNLTGKTVGTAALLAGTILGLTACSHQQDITYSGTPETLVSGTPQLEVNKTYYKLTKIPDTGKFGYIYASSNLLRVEAQEVDEEGT